MNITDKKEEMLLLRLLLRIAWEPSTTRNGHLLHEDETMRFLWLRRKLFFYLKIAQILRISVNTNKIHSRICLFRQNIFCWVIQIHGQLELCLVRFDVSDIKFTSRFDKTLGLTVKFLKNTTFYD